MKTLLAECGSYYNVQTPQHTSTTECIFNTFSWNISILSTRLFIIFYFVIFYKVCFLLDILFMTLRALFRTVEKIVFFFLNIFLLIISYFIFYFYGNELRCFVLHSKETQKYFKNEDVDNVFWQRSFETPRIHGTRTR